jgi:hypothetical protein
MTSSACRLAIVAADPFVPKDSHSMTHSRSMAARVASAAEPGGTGVVLSQ